MLHRLALRVLPELALAVTEERVRKQKRLIMLAPGLIAFGIYRVVKQIHPLVDPVTLLCVSGFISAVTAIVAFRVGRQVGFGRLWKEDGLQQLGWVIGWIGFIYGVQLSLMVLALLKICVNYDFLRHPDGPAMMAIIIACTSVARDAFEIGHVRWLQAAGRPVLTFPDGKSLRHLVQRDSGHVVQWALVGGGLGACAAWGLAELGEWGGAPLTQLIAVTLAGGTVALWSYLVGVQQTGTFAARWKTLRYSELFRFWWWPGLAFSATYYLVAAGALTFVLRSDPVTGGTNAIVGVIVGGLMAVYGYYLGYRRFQEDRVHQAMPASLLRCPFVMGIVTRGRASTSSTSLASSGVALRESGEQGSL